MMLSNLFSALLQQVRKRTGQRDFDEAAQLLEKGFRQLRAGDLDGARQSAESLLEADPDNAEAHHLLGIVHAQRGRFDSAEKHLLRAIGARPGIPDAHIDLGNVYGVRHDLVKAESSYRKALSLAPDAEIAHFNLALLLKEIGKRDQALEHFRRAHFLAPERGDMLWSLVLTLTEQKRYDEAVEVAEAAVKACPDCYEAQASLGLAYLKTHALTEALACCDKALRLRTDDAELHTYRGVVLQNMGRLPEAFASYDRALELRPDFPLARFHRALAYLLVGDYARGWPDYEVRLISEDKPWRPKSYPRWDDQSLAGRTILIYGEQGLGDEIMYASCLPQLIREAGHCVIECAPKLESLFRRSFPDATIYAAMPDRTIPSPIANTAIDLEVPLESLPLHYRRDIADFPAHEGFLMPDAQRVARWRERLAALGPGVKVGISWIGGSYESRRPMRSIGLDHWLPILSVDSARFVSLQYTSGAADEVAKFRQRHGIDVVHWPEAIEDYEETAALVIALDVTISVCTAVVHLTGALGRPVWIMAPYSPEWRYGLAGKTMPWYPSARVFRQEQDMDWGPVVLRVADELFGLAEGKVRRK